MKKLRKPGRTRIAAVAAAVLAAGVVASLAATGYAARIVAFSHTSPTAAQYPSSKVTICHHTHSAKNPFVTITVSVHALPAHMKHGDTVGPCPQTPVGAPVAPVKQHKLHKVHKANHGANKSDLRAHGKAAKTHVKSNRGHHQQNTVQGNAPTTVHGKSHAHVKTNSPTKSHGPGNGKAKGHTKTHTKTNGQGNAHNQTHGQGHGHGQGGQGQGQGPGTGGVVTHGNGKGNGHKP